MTEVALDIQYVTENIAEHLPVDDLLRVCRISKSLARLCENDDYWHRRLVARAGSTQEYNNYKQIYVGLAHCFGESQIADLENLNPHDKSFLPCIEHVVRTQKHTFLEFLVDHVIKQREFLLFVTIAFWLGLGNYGALIDKLDAHFPHFDKSLAFVGTIEGNNKSLTERLLNSGDVNLSTALINAAWMGSQKAIMFIVKMGIRNPIVILNALNASIDSGHTDIALDFIKMLPGNLDHAIIRAADQGKTELLQKLLSFYGNMIDDQTLQRAIGEAIRRKQSGSVNLLLDTGVIPETKYIERASGILDENTTLRMLDRTSGQLDKASIGYESGRQGHEIVIGRMLREGVPLNNILYGVVEGNHLDLLKRLIDKRRMNLDLVDELLHLAKTNEMRQYLMNKKMEF